MGNNFSMTNKSFSDLGKSSDFLNLILENINSCVVLLDKDMKLKAYNSSLKTIFSNKKDENLLYKRCGEVIGCAHQIEEQKDCGKTSMCDFCDLRLALINSYVNNESIYKDNIVRHFYDFNNIKEEKHLEISTRLFQFDKDKYVLMIIDDVTKYFKYKDNHN